MKLDQFSFGEVRAGGVIALEIDVTHLAQKGHVETKLRQSEHVVHAINEHMVLFQEVKSNKKGDIGLDNVNLLKNYVTTSNWNRDVHGSK